MVDKKEKPKLPKEEPIKTMELKLSAMEKSDSKVKKKS